MEITSLAHNAFEMNAQLDVFSTDISNVNTSLLIRKLAKFLVSNALLKWLSSYSYNRKQYVKVNSSKSTTFNVLSGAGQGTILGPLLFTVFFDDSNIDLSGVYYMNFADDKQIAVIVKRAADTQKLQSAIDHLMAWCDNNRLFANESKCKAITFTQRGIQYYTIIL